jgi:hypothetical protein
MFKHLVQFEKEIQGFKSYWHLDNGMPTTVAKEMLLYFLKCIGQIEDQNQAQAQPPLPPADEVKKEDA